MGLRVLVIDDEEVYRRLLKQHVATAFESATVADFDPLAQGRMPRDFPATVYDVVLLDDRPGEGTGLDWLRDLRSRANFPPIVYFLSEHSAEAEAEAIDAGAYACLSKRRIQHKQLVATLRAIHYGDRQPGPSVGSEALDRASRFGGHVIRGYHFLGKLAENPVSTVYLAKSLKGGSEVALKVLTQPSESWDRNADAFGRFLREYDIASGIRHPNVVRIFDFGACDEYAFIAMEYFPNGDLRARIRQGIAPNVALSLLRQMAEALKVLHGAGVLHRDLKPGNVMLRDDHSVVLIDFGMSKQLEIQADFTGRGQIFGTPHYMSPEQGHGRETDERSDLYSLGIMFFEMLMRRKPYVAATPMQVIYKHANDPLPQLRAEFRRYEPILHKCVAKDPRHRYACADELIEAIRDAQRDAGAGEAMGF